MPLATTLIPRRRKFWAEPTLAPHPQSIPKVDRGHPQGPYGHFSAPGALVPWCLGAPGPQVRRFRVAVGPQPVRSRTAAGPQLGHNRAAGVSQLRHRHDDRSVDTVHFGKQVRVARMDRRLRQVDVAQRAGVSRQTVGRIERGQIRFLCLDRLIRVTEVLEVDVVLAARGRGAELDRLVAAGHSALQAHVAKVIRAMRGWIVLAEVGFDTGRERGAIDLLAWHAASRTLLIVEVKTEIVDPGGHARQLDRYRRVAPMLAGRQGWRPNVVATWLVLAGGSRNRRIAKQFEPILAPRGMTDPRAMRRWLRAPSGPVDSASFIGLAGNGSTPGDRARRLHSAHRVRLRGARRRAELS